MTWHLQTSRLLVRPWRDNDADVFRALHSEPDVSHWLGGPFSNEQIDRLFTRVRQTFEQRGYGVLALETADGKVIGAAGLQPAPDDLPIAPAIECAWRLSRPFWGLGLAGEAMRALLSDAVARCGIQALVAITAEQNISSQRLMQRLEFVRDEAGDFDHPRLPLTHPLRRHVVYRWTAPRLEVTQDESGCGFTPATQRLR